MLPSREIFHNGKAIEKSIMNGGKREEELHTDICLIKSESTGSKLDLGRYMYQVQNWLPYGAENPSRAVQTNSKGCDLHARCDSGYAADPDTPRSFGEHVSIMTESIDVEMTDAFIIDQNQIITLNTVEAAISENASETQTIRAKTEIEAEVVVEVRHPFPYEEDSDSVGFSLSGPLLKPNVNKHATLRND
ncbi:hypothetical protein HG531_007014 [Fusarium graminearum]|nr:hypothetical protein HG531_007014 [Fusarium graminearum]